jgi:hypothetical protein
MKLKLILALIVFAQVSYAQGFLSKQLAKVAKKVGGGQTTAAASLNDIVPTVSVTSNLHSEKLGTMSQAIFTGWKGGSDGVSVLFSKQHEAGFFKIDGSVTVDGQPLEYFTSGTYGLVIAPGSGPRKIEVTTSNGEKSGFVVEPSKKVVKLASINGQEGENAAIDITKDVVLGLTYAPELEGQLMKVSIAITQLSFKSIFDVCYLKIAPKVTVPASAFRNINIAPAGKAVYNFKNSYLQIGTESLEEAKEVTGVFKRVEYVSNYSDGKFVNVTGEPDINRGIADKDTDKGANMVYNFFRPNAFLSRPLSHVKKIGLSSLTIRGTTYHASSESSVSETSTATITTTTTTTLVFPQLPNEKWDALLEKFYVNLVGVIESELGATVVPVEKVTQAPAYQMVQSYSKADENTKVQFSRAFRDTKVISAWIPVTEGYGPNSNNERLMNESGTDALMNVTIDLDISQEAGGELVLMVPMLAIDITGRMNGLSATTKYFKGTIQSTAGVAFKNDIDIAGLEAIIRESDMMTALRSEIRRLKEKEKSNGDYEAVWKLRE